MNLLIRGRETWVNDIRNPTVRKILNRSESDEVRNIYGKESDDTIGSTVYKKKNKVDCLCIPYSFRFRIVVLPISIGSHVPKNFLRTKIYNIRTIFCK